MLALAIALWVSPLDHAVHTLAIDWQTCVRSRDGHVWCWGDDGQTRPVEIAGLPRVAGVAAAIDTTCAWTPSGSVWCWRGTHGRPTPIAGFANVVELVGNGKHVCARAADGAVTCLTEPESSVGFGPVAPIPFARDARAIAVGGNEGCSLDGHGHVTCWSFPEVFHDKLQPIDLPDLTGATAIAVRQMSVDSLYALVGSTVHRIWLLPRGITADVESFPAPERPKTGPAPRNVTRIVAGGFGACALGDVVTCWDDELQPREMAGSTGATDLAIGGNSACFRTATGHPACWGQADRVGDGSLLASASPVDVPDLGDVIRLEASRRICALRATGEVACWGESLADEHGPIDAVPVAVAIPPAVDLVVGDDVACARDRHDDVWCWGFDVLHPDHEHAVSPQVIARLHGATLLVPLESTICGVVGTKSICVGDNDQDALDLVPPRTSKAWRGGSLVCTRASDGIVRCNKNLIAELRSTRVMLGASATPPGVEVGRDVTAVGEFWGHPCVVDGSGVLRCEAGNSGIFPLRDVTPFRHLDDVTGITTRCVLHRDGRVSCGARDAKLAEVVTNALAIVGDDDFTCALRSTGHVACWGENDYLGTGAHNIHDTPSELALEL